MSHQNELRTRDFILTLFLTPLLSLGGGAGLFAVVSVLDIPRGAARAALLVLVVVFPLLVAKVVTSDRTLPALEVVSLAVCPNIPWFLLIAALVASGDQH
jgi:hypothetical protein